METFIIPYEGFFTPVQRICSPSWELKSDGNAVAFFLLFISSIYFFSLQLAVARVVNETPCGKCCSDLPVIPLIYAMEPERFRHTTGRHAAQTERPRNKMRARIWSCISIAVFHKIKAIFVKFVFAFVCLRYICIYFLCIIPLYRYLMKVSKPVSDT